MKIVAVQNFLMLCGESGEAYNIAEEHSDIMLKDLVVIIAGFKGEKVVFEIPDAVEATGYSTATKARLDGHMLAALGWKPRYDICIEIKRTMQAYLLHNLITFSVFICNKQNKQN